MSPSQSLLEGKNPNLVVRTALEGGEGRIEGEEGDREGPPEPLLALGVERGMERDPTGVVGGVISTTVGIITILIIIT